MFRRYLNADHSLLFIHTAESGDSRLSLASLRTPRMHLLQQRLWRQIWRSVLDDFIYVWPSGRPLVIILWQTRNKPFVITSDDKSDKSRKNKWCGQQKSGVANPLIIHCTPKITLLLNCLPFKFPHLGHPDVCTYVSMFIHLRYSFILQPCLQKCAHK